MGKMGRQKRKQVRKEWVHERVDEGEGFRSAKYVACVTGEDEVNHKPIRPTRYETRVSEQNKQASKQTSEQLLR